MTAPTSIPMIFVNLPSTDIVRARAFYAGLGFSFDERFCNADSLLVGVSDAIHLMILDRERFASFSPRRSSVPSISLPRSTAAFGSPVVPDV